MKEKKKFYVFWFLLAGFFLYYAFRAVTGYGPAGLTWLVLVIPCAYLGYRNYISCHAEAQPEKAEQQAEETEKTEH